MSPEQYVAWQESIGRGVVVLCPACSDWEDIEDAVFDDAGNFWCCFGCCWSGSPHMPPGLGYQTLMTRWSQSIGITGGQDAAR